MPIQLYSASAGSGKTYRLAIEYISLAIHKEDPFGYFRKILAVTFTNKAAQEMRERILKFLHEIYAQKNSELITSVSNSLEKYSVDLNHELIIERAKNAHHQILQDYGLFSVMTIDSFVQKLSGSFWNELNLPNNYEIELDSDKIVDQVLNSILHKIQLEENQDLKTIFLNLVDETIDSESGWNGIRDSIKKFLKDVFSEDFLEVEEEFKSLKTEDFLYLNKKLKDFISKVEKAYLSTAQELCQIIQTNGYDHAEYWSYKNSGTIAHLFKLISGNKSINDNISRFPCDQEKLFNGLMDDSFIEKIYEGLCNLNNFRTNNLINYLFAIEIKKQMNNMAILRYFQNELSDFQNSKGIIPIAEFSKKIYQTIANDPVPFIYEKLGDRYEHLLIDEFQDTSMLQWKNFMPLLENASDGINQNLLVGDSKQAIYSFRGGDVKIFDALDNNREYNFNLGELDAIRFSNLKSRIDKKSMNDNYRSNPTIVEFNNQFYDFILKDTSSKSELLRNIYQNNIRQNAKKNDITLASDLEVFFSPNLKVSERNEIHKKSVLNKIIELSNEKIGYDKMAVLTRTNFQLSIIVEELLGNGIPIKSSDSLFIDFSPLYNFIKSILYFRINPDSKFHFFNIIHYSNLISDKKIDLNKLELTENRKEILIRTFSELGIDIKGIFQSKLGLIDTVHLI
ncbi:MAG: hypothetical protein RIR51_1199, partial [Bacteroidota bacterium]